MEVLMDKVWAGIDAGKGFRWAHVLDASGTRLLSRKVENEEANLSKLIDRVLSLADDVVWAIDQPGGGVALLLALLWDRGHRVLYIPGLTVDRSRDAYRGKSKTDARDARVIAYPRLVCAPTSVSSLLAKTILPSSNSCSLADAISSSTKAAA